MFVVSLSTTAGWGVPPRTPRRVLTVVVPCVSFIITVIYDTIARDE